MSILNKNVSKKMSQTLKRRFLAKLPWVHKRAAFSSSCSYEEIPAAHTHQEEMDENLANEALEARLMELIANAPQQESHVRLSLVVSSALVGGHTATLPSFSTRCQRAEGQTLP